MSPLRYRKPCVLVEKILCPACSAYGVVDFFAGGIWEYGTHGVLKQERFPCLGVFAVEGGTLGAYLA